MKKLKKLLQRPKNSFYLGLLLGFLFLISLLFPIIQLWSLMLFVDIPLEGSFCCRCYMPNFNLFFIVAFILWTTFCIYKVTTFNTYRPLRISLFMLIGYILTNDMIATFFPEAMCSKDGQKYFFLFLTAPFASLTPIIYGLIFNIIAIRKNKNNP